MRQLVTPAIAESLGLDKPTGALVSSVSKDGPADQGSIQVGDIIVEFNGTMIEQSKDLAFMVARTPSGREVAVKVLREGKERDLPVTIGEPEKKQAKEEEVVVSLKTDGDLGLTIQEITPQIAESLELEDTEGVVITSVEPGSLADEAGLRRSDIIRKINRESIHDLKDFREATAKMKKGKSVLFLVQREDTTLFLAMKNR